MAPGSEGIEGRFFLLFDFEGTKDPFRICGRNPSRPIALAGSGMDIRPEIEPGTGAGVLVKIISLAIGLLCKDWNFSGKNIYILPILWDIQNFLTGELKW